MEPTQRTKNAPSIVANVIEDNNIVHSVITIDIVERSPTPIIIYNVEGELDSPVTKDDNK
jgi:hypothetical protein